MNSIRLSYPVKALWPNGRAHRMAKARAVKAARLEAWGATLAVCTRDLGFGLTLPEGDIPVSIVVHPKPRGPVPDRDNCLSAAKAYLDGIADALGVNDVWFAPLPVEIGERKPGGEVVIRILGAQE